MAEKEPEEINEPDEAGEPSNSPTPAAAENKTVLPAPANPQQESDITKLEKHMDKAEGGMLFASRVSAFFTIVLALLAFIQAISFIESERAFLLVTDVKFLKGDPSLDAGGMDLLMNVKNVGRHVASVSRFVVRPANFIFHKELAAVPSYEIGIGVEKVAPPSPQVLI
jgi:hypothetical protein